MIWFDQLRKRLSAPSDPWRNAVVEFDDTSINLDCSGKRNSIEWKSLGAISVVTTDHGPWADDFFWILFESVGGVEPLSKFEIPSGASNISALIEKFKQLPGFDEAMLAEAVKCTDNAHFPLWKRSV